MTDCSRDYTHDYSLSVDMVTSHIHEQSKIRYKNRKAMYIRTHVASHVGIVDWQITGLVKCIC